MEQINFHSVEFLYKLATHYAKTNTADEKPSSSRLQHIEFFDSLDDESPSIRNGRTIESLRKGYIRVEL